MLRKHFLTRAVPALLLLAALPAGAQNFMVQCPTTTLLHPIAATSGSGEPTYTGPQALNTTANGVSLTYISNGGAVKCQHISGGDGYMTEADGNQTYMFSFGPLSGLDKIQNGQPGTDFPDEFNRPYCNSTGAYTNGQPNPYSPTGGVNPLNPTAPPDPRFNCGANGAVGYVPPPGARQATGTTALGSATQNVATCPTAAGCRVSGITVVDPGAGYTAAPTVSIDPPPCTINGTTCVRATAIAVIGTGSVIEAAIQIPGAGYINAPNVTFSAPVGTSLISGTDPAAIMNTGTMNGNIPAPLMAFDEDDEFFLTLTNVGMIMRPDLFEQHTVHFHGYPNASAFYDGVPDASVAINIAASFTYYYLAPDAGTYFWHCHITPPEHLQMGMVGQLYVRPRQNRVAAGTNLYTSRALQDNDLRTACVSANDVLCSNPLPTANTGVTRAATGMYAYNDGDGSTYYDVEYPIQMHGFDPNFHFVGMTFNPEGFADMKDKYFLLNGRSYPDTVSPGPLQTQSADGVNHFSQPLASIIDIPAGRRALLRISDLNTSEYHTLASLGIPMQVIGYNAKLLRDQAGNNLYYTTNSITLGGGESLDVILDTCAVRSVPADPSSPCTTAMATGTYYLYTPNLDHLSNDAENFGGQMTEVHVN
jgi:Multicopper oxidase